MRYIKRFESLGVEVKHVHGNGEGIAHAQNIVSVIPQVKYAYF